MNHRQHEALAPHLGVNQVGNKQRNGHSSDHEISNGQVDQEVVGMLSTCFCFYERGNGHSVGKHYQDSHKAVRGTPECSLDAGQRRRYSYLGN